MVKHSFSKSYFKIGFSSKEEEGRVADDFVS